MGLTGRTDACMGAVHYPARRLSVVSAPGRTSLGQKIKIAPIRQLADCRGAILNYIVSPLDCDFEEIAGVEKPHFFRFRGDHKVFDIREFFGQGILMSEMPIFIKFHNPVHAGV